MDRKELESALEAILFASGEPVQVDRICVALDIDRPTVEQLLQKLMDYYAYERRGIRLLKIDDSWQLCSAPDYAETIRKAFEIRKPAKLSQPALEVLTIIAYYQPTTRAYVDQIRGVDSSYTVGLLLDPEDPAESLDQQLKRGNDALYRATLGKTRLAYVPDAEKTELQALEEVGWSCLPPDMDRTDYKLESAANAAALLKRVSARRRDVSVWLGTTASAAGVKEFVSSAQREGHYCRAMTE